MTNESEVRLTAIQAAGWYCLGKEVNRNVRRLGWYMAVGTILGVTLGALLWRTL